MSKAPVLKPIERPGVDRTLTRCAFVGNIGRCRELLEPTTGRAADIAEKDVYGCTALTWAVRNGSVDVTKYLLAQEADVESVSYGGFKPVHHACNGSREAALKEIIDSGCNVSSADETGSTGMHWAAARGVLNVVLQMLEAGARPDEKNTAGATPLHRAANNGHLNIVLALLKEGANPNEQDASGNTPLHAAASTGFDSVAKALIDAGAKSMANRAGKVPVDVAPTSSMKAELARAA